MFKNKIICTFCIAVTVGSVFYDKFNEKILAEGDGSYYREDIRHKDIGGTWEHGSFWEHGKKCSFSNLNIKCWKRTWAEIGWSKAESPLCGENDDAKCTAKGGAWWDVAKASYDVY